MIEGLKRRYFVLTASGCFSQLMLFGVGSMYQIPYFFRADKADCTSSQLPSNKLLFYSSYSAHCSDV